MVEAHPKGPVSLKKIGCHFVILPLKVWKNHILINVTLDYQMTGSNQ